MASTLCCDGSHAIYETAAIGSCSFMTREVDSPSGSGSPPSSVTLRIVSSHAALTKASNPRSDE